MVDLSTIQGPMPPPRGLERARDAGTLLIMVGILVTLAPRFPFVTDRIGPATWAGPAGWTLAGCGLVMTVVARVMLDKALGGDARARLERRRDAARWAIVVGVAMLFMGGVTSSLALGGTAMCVWGIGMSIYAGRALRKLDGDPWKDEEIDAWEEEHYGRP